MNMIENKHKWTQTLLDKSENLTKAVVIPNSFADGNFSEQLIKNLIFNIIAQNEIGSAMRVYVDGGDNPEYKQRLCAKKIEKNQTLFDWLISVFGDKSFGVIVNKAESYSAELLESIANIFVPVIDKIGFPLGGMEIGIFMGNYGYTPFGIHKDKDEEVILHMHMGPNIKEMFLWDPETFENIARSNDFYFNFEKVMPYGEKYTIPKNAVFVLPAKNYHIGYTPNFSIGIAVALLGMTKRKLFSSVLASIDEDINFDINDDSLDFSSMQAKDIEYGNTIKNNITKNSLANLSLNKLLKIYANDYRFSLLSNCGFNISGNEIQTPKSLKGKTFKIVSPFFVYYQKVNKQYLFVYARRYKFTIRCFSGLIPLLDKINSGKQCFHEDLSKLIQRENQDILDDLLVLLLRYNAIEIC